MRARLMIHDGKATIVVPAEVSRFYDDTLKDYVSQELIPAKEIVYDLPDGAKYGGYPVRKNVPVKPELQSAMYDKGFKFVRTEDETAFLAERKAVEAEKAKRDKAEADAAAIVEKQRIDALNKEQKASDDSANAAPSGDIVFGDPAVPVEEKKAVNTDAPAVGTGFPIIDTTVSTDPIETNKGGK